MHATGLDIARLVSQKAACVYVCAREWRSAKDLAAPAVRGCSNVQRRGMISHLTAAGQSAWTTSIRVQLGGCVEVWGHGRASWLWGCVLFAYQSTKLQAGLRGLEREQRRWCSLRMMRKRA